MKAVTVEYTTPEGTPPVALLRMDDGKANVFNPNMLAALVAALDEVEQSDAHALVISGRAGFFSGGLDLKALPSLPTDEKRAVFQRFGEVLLRVFTFRVPTVAAVTGHAIAGGALLALAVDVRHGVDLPARFGVTEVALGLPVPRFGLLLARAALAPAALTEVALHGAVLSMREARERGVFRALHADDAVVDAAVRCGAELARIDGPSYAATKRTLWAAELERVTTGLPEEVAHFIELFEARFAAAPA